MDMPWESVLIFVAAAVLTAVVVWVTRFKMRGATKIAVNSLAGGALLAGLSALNVLVLPCNLFNALLVGVLGLPGAGVVIAAALLL